MNEVMILEKQSHGRLDPKHFYRKLESIFAEIGSAMPAEKYAHTFTEKFFSAFRDPLKIQTALLFDCLTTPEVISKYGDDLPDLRFHFPAELPWSGWWEDTLMAIL